jgi:hypothetical protein
MLVMLLTACGGGDGDSSRRASDKARTTVLVYVVGSDLEGLRLNPDGTLSDQFGNQATGNIEEMQKVGSSKDVHIILETGGAKKEGWHTVRRQRVVKGGMEVITDLGTHRMTDGQHLRNFIEWGVKAYPAETYHLVFWNHGGGPLGGFGPDQNYYPEMKTLLLPELTHALEGAQRTTGVKLDLIGFDACLMASAEIAYLLQPHANYLVASEDVEPGGGWDWETYLRHISENPESTAVTAGKAIVDGYVAKMQGMGERMITLSVTDLSKVTPLMDKLNDIADTILHRLDTAAPQQRYQAWADLAYARRATHDFQTSWFYDNTYDLVDLGDFLTMPKLGPLNVTEDQIQDAQTALQEAVIYHKHGQRLWQSSGLTLYSPMVSVKDYITFNRYTAYATLNVPDNLKRLVQLYGDMANSPELPKPTIGPMQAQGDVLYSTLQNPQFSAVEYMGLWSNSTTRLAIKPLDAQAPESASDNTLIAGQKNEGWFIVPSADGADVLVSVLPDDMPRYATGYAQYSIPVEREASETVSGTRGVLLVDYQEDENGGKTYRIVSFLGYYDASPYASRSDSQSLVANTVFYPMAWTIENGWQADRTRKIVSYDVGEEDSPRETWWQLQTVTADSLCGGDCQFSFESIDFQGKVAF